MKLDKHEDDVPAQSIPSPSFYCLLVMRGNFVQASRKLKR